MIAYTNTRSLIGGTDILRTLWLVEYLLTGAIIGDGDRNWVSFSVMGLSLSKKTNVLFLAKIAPYARDARACNC